ncbi:MAG: carboxypeptidase-like regulatory domain-containing protein, partial [Chitinophagaceae bacterium]|nr:carboxypeptidase-like regulatory domain-containing protein [Chitinophagaceae bacterium]
MKFFYYNIIFFLFIFTSSAFSQTVEIYGKIAELDTKEYIDYATIVLKKSSDGKIITGIKSNNNGNFLLQKIEPDNYTISVSSIGFETVEIKNISVTNQQAKLDIGTILLPKKVNKINEVVIEGKKQNIELQAGKIVFNVEQNITSAGGVAEDILKNVPGVNVDVDGGLSMRGKDNITLLVDGKQSAMFGSDVATALQNIPAASIESIEVINNPGAKYESQGIGGIINIILKKDKKRGMNASITLGGGFPYQLNSGFNFNATTSQKWNHFINANFRDRLNCEDNDYVATLYSNGNKTSSFSTNDRT